MIPKPAAAVKNLPSVVPGRPRRPLPAANFANWDPDRPPNVPDCAPTALPSSSAAARALSPLARYVYDALRRGWGATALAELRKLRRVPAGLVSEVLDASSDPVLASRFFHWASKQPRFRHNYSSYNALARCLARAGRHRAADQVPELMAAQGRPPTEKQFEILLKMHVEAGRGLRVHHLFDKMRHKFQLTPKVFFYNRIMEALVRTGYVDLAMSVYRSFLEDGLKEESVTFMILAKGLCKVARVDEALEILMKMRRDLCRPDIFAYTAMLKLVSDGNECRKLWAAMVEDGVRPDVMAYTLMIEKLCKCGNSDEALVLFKEMKEKKLLVDRAVYGVLVEALVSDGKLNVASDLVKEMVGDGYRADVGIYSSLIGGMCAAGRRDKAWNLLRVAVKEGLSPGPAAIHPILLSFSGEPEKVAKMVNSLADAGIPVVSILETFFLAASGDGDRAIQNLDLFLKLKSQGFESVTMYNSLIQGLYKGNHPEKAITLFSGMSDVLPETETFSAVIPCFVATSNLVEACEIYNKMRELSSVPNSEAYRALVKGLCRSGEIAGTIGMVGDCLANVVDGPREFKYALAVLRLCRRGNVTEVVKVLDEMAEEGVRAEEAVCAAVIHGFCSGGVMANGGKEVLRKMEERGMITEKEHVVYREMMMEQLKRSAAGLMLSGLKFFGLEGKLKLTKELTYHH